MKEQFSFYARLLFWSKSRLLILRRTWHNVLKPVQFHGKHSLSDSNSQLFLEIRSPLFGLETDPNEIELQLGKIENLRIAARHLDRLSIAKGEVFSFWKQVGRPTRSKGYVVGRELRQGCLIPTVAGGICQLSNSLYQAAKRSGMEIIERHGHTQAIEGSVFAQGEDATVFWNYVDLRFRATCDVILGVKLTKSELVVRLDRRE